MAGYKGMRFARSAHVDTWVPRYLAGESTTAIARSEGVLPESVRLGLIRRGVQIRSVRERAHRAFTCDEGFFDSVGGEAQAYWLGFIAADGNVYKQTLGFGVAAVDSEHLRAFVTAIGGNQEVVHRLNSSNRPSAWLKINSVRMVEALARYGITPRKSLTLEWPPLPVDLERHFLRGYIDGDGSWHMHPSRVGRPSWVCSFVGSPMFVTHARDVLAAACGLRILAPHATKSVGIQRVVYGGNQQVARIARWLYDGATVYLPRKKVLADAAIAEAAKTHRRT